MSVLPCFSQLQLIHSKAYVSLSSLPERSLEDGPMNLVAYYENIHALLALDDRTGISQKLLDDMTAFVLPFHHRCVLTCR